MLVVRDLNAWYGGSHALQGVSIEVARGEVVSLIGRNGAGKTTTIKSIMGLMGRTTGTVEFDGDDILARPVHERFARGLAYVPEERRIVPGLTVRENILLGIVQKPGAHDERETVDRVAQSFPRLKERLSQVADTMSGGEQQMLAIARAAVAGPKMIMLDEPSEGIMPVLVDEMFEQFADMKKTGTTILLVEQNVGLALSISDRAYILDQGRVVHHAPAAQLLADREIQERYCAV